MSGYSGPTNLVQEIAYAENITQVQLAVPNGASADIPGLGLALPASPNRKIWLDYGCMLITTVALTGDFEGQIQVIDLATGFALAIADVAIRTGDFATAARSVNESVAIPASAVARTIKLTASGFYGAGGTVAVDNGFTGSNVGTFPNKSYLTAYYR